MPSNVQPDQGNLVRFSCVRSLAVLRSGFKLFGSRLSSSSVRRRHAYDTQHPAKQHQLTAMIFSCLVSSLGNAPARLGHETSYSRLSGDKGSFESIRSVMRKRA